MCTFGKMYNLREGLSLLEKHKKNNEFNKAAKERAISIRDKTHQKNIEAFDSDVLNKYTSLLDNSC